jgi:hypothetical protein
MLVREGYPDILITRADRETYIDALRDGHSGNKTRMVEAFSDLLLKDRRAKLFDEILQKI